MVNKPRRLLFGLFVLLIVDVIWVSSSELTKVTLIYKTPYVYQHEAFEKPFFSTYVKTSMFTIYLLGLCFYPPWKEYCQKTPKYTQLETDVEDEPIENGDDNDSLSPPTYVPLKWAEKPERCSGSESDDATLNKAVRHMSDVNAGEAFWARLSYHASLKAGCLAKRAADRLSIEQVAKIAFYFCFLWFVANYTFQAALAYTEASSVSLLSSSSSLFTLLLSAVFPSSSADKFTLSKLVAVITSIGGLVMVSIADASFEIKLPLGIILSIISAFFYASYLVFLRRVVDNDNKMEIPIFFGFVGLFNFLLLWPTFFLLHYCKWESFEWPNKHQWTLLIVNGLVGTVLSEALWLWGCLMTSSLIATLALSLTIPLTMLADRFLSSVTYSSIFYVGTVPVLASFLFITFLFHYEKDPLYDLIKKLSPQEPRLSEAELEQRESLISVEDDHEA